MSDTVRADATHYSFRMMNLRAPLLPLALLLAGCAGSAHVVEEGNYYTSYHAFNERAEEAARTGAERHCTERKRVAVQISRTCSLTHCTTHYQCVTSEDVERLALPPAKK